MNIRRIQMFVPMLDCCESAFEMLVQWYKGRKYHITSSLATPKNMTLEVIRVRDTCESLYSISNKKELSCKK